MTLTVNIQGAEIPALGFGTWELRVEECEQAVIQALEAGYRHIDTAQIYENEDHVGRALEQAGLPRGDLFVTTKVWTTAFLNGELQRSAEVSLHKLRLDYVDLLLLHWPNPAVPMRETLNALADVKQRGLAKHIGVSNFSVALMDDAAALCPEPLFMNQVEYHPYLDQTAVLQAAQRHHMGVTAYSPLAKGRVFKDKLLLEIAKAKGKTAGQIALRWLNQQPGVIAIPRSAKREHILANFDIHDFELTPDEMSRISAIGSPTGRFINPSWAPVWDA